MQSCPLCNQNKSLESYHQDKNRAYLQCNNCQLISVEQQYMLSAEQEKAQYDHHQNNPNDKGYRQFLSRAVTPLFNKIKKQAKGLDFGCGPGPTISVMAEEAGIEVSNYDLYYYNEPELLTKQYDFITMTEVIEHLAKPKAVLKQLNEMLKADSTLAIMTKRVIDKEHFKQWHYKNDPTHISFYSIETFEWIAKKYQWQLDVIDKDVVFYNKKSN